MSNKDNIDRAVDTLLTDEAKDGAEGLGLSNNFIMHLYHSSGRDKDKINTFFENINGLTIAEKVDTIDQNIDNHREVIKSLKKLRKGLIKEFIVNDN